MNNKAPTADDAFKEKLGSRYIESLLEDVMPFWERHALDQKCGGYLSILDRDGTVVDTDKAVWVQGRMAWMFSSLYFAIEPRQSRLSHAKLGIDFLEAHCFAPSGKMYFLVTRNGQPLRMRRHFFSEAFSTVAFAAYAKAVGSLRHRKLAIDVFKSIGFVAAAAIKNYHPLPSPTRYHAMSARGVRNAASQK